MLPKLDGSWLKILEQKGWVFCAMALFFGVFRYLLAAGMLPGLSKYTWLPDAVLLAAILFAILAVGSIAHWLTESVPGATRGWRARRKILARLDSLSEIEHRILSYLVQDNSQSFNYRIDDGDVQLLVQKGLLLMAGGHQNVFAVPFLIPDFVWRELRKRSDEFSSAAPPQDPPWVKSWMAY